MRGQDKDGQIFDRFMQDISYQSQSSGRYARMEPAQALVQGVLKALHKANVSGESLHDRFGVSANTFRLYSKGVERMSSRLLVQICDTLGVTPDAFHHHDARRAARPEIVESAIMFVSHVGMDDAPPRLLEFLKSQMELVRTLETENLDGMPDHYERFRQIRNIVRDYAPVNTYGAHWMPDIGDVRASVLDMVDFATKGTWLRNGLDKKWHYAEDAAIKKVCEAGIDLLGMRNAQPWSDAFLVQAKKMGFEAAQSIARIAPDAIYPLDMERWNAPKVDAYFDAYREWWNVKLAIHRQQNLRVNKAYHTKHLFALRQWAANPGAQDYLDAEINARYIETHTGFSRQGIKQIFPQDNNVVGRFVSPSRRLDAWQRMYGPI